MTDTATPAPSGAVIFVARFAAFDDDERAAFFSSRATAAAWLVSNIDPDEWMQWAASLVAHEPDAHAAKPGVDSDDDVLEAWFGDHQIVVRESYPGLKNESWGAGPEVYASIEEVIVDDPKSTWSDW